MTSSRNSSQTSEGDRSIWNWTYLRLLTSLGGIFSSGPSNSLISLLNGSTLWHNWFAAAEARFWLIKVLVGLSVLHVAYVRETLCRPPLHSSGGESQPKKGSVKARRLYHPNLSCLLNSLSFTTCWWHPAFPKSAQETTEKATTLAQFVSRFLRPFVSRQVQC